MTKDVGKPSWLKNVCIFLVGGETIERDLSFNDYIGLMWNLKTKAFITLGTETINKMNIIKIDTDLSPHVAMGVNDFVHYQKKSSLESGMSREEIYNHRCDGLSARREENKKFTINEWRTNDY